MNGKIFFSAMATVTALFASPQEEKGFIDNNLRDIAMNGSRVVTVNEQGLNWCNNLRDSSNSWSALTNIEPYTIYSSAYHDAITLAESEMVVRLSPKELELSWIYYDFDNGQYETSSFEPENLIPIGTDNKLYGYRGDYVDGQFYLAMYHGGILRVENGDATGIIIPDADTILPVDYEYPEDGFSESKWVRSLFIEDSIMTVLTETRLKEFNLNSNTWISDTDISEENDDIEWVTIEPSSSGPLILGYDSINDGTALYMLENDTPVETIKSDIYSFLESNDSIIYTTILTDSITPFDTDGNVIDSLDTFAQRIQNAEGFGGDYAINDIAYSSDGSRTNFAIATRVGILFSTDFDSDNETNEPFTYIRKDISVESGLKEVFAIPFIINNEQNNGTSYFKYSLTEDADVSIDIFDYNMDFVCRIIDNQPRLAGKNSGSGLSGDRAHDYWDGTFRNNGSQMVAPGLYYFRITTTRGEQGFGKIIIAKN